MKRGVWILAAIVRMVGCFDDRAVSFSLAADMDFLCFALGVARGALP
jgi:hypothetical protein